MTLTGGSLSSAVVRRIAAQVGPCASRSIEVSQEYPQREVYPARALLEGLAEYAGSAARPEGSLRLRARRVIAAAAAQPDGAVITLDDVAHLLGVTSRTHGRYKHLRRVVSGLDVGTVEPGAASRTKTVRRRVGREDLYPARALLERMLEAGRGCRNDQRDLRQFGAVRSTAEIAATLTTVSGHRNHSIPVASPLHLPPADLLITPYALGAWLGDGTTTASMLTTADAEMVGLLAAEGVATRATPDPIVFALSWASRPRWGDLQERECGGCGQFFRPSRAQQRNCRHGCRAHAARPQTVDVCDQCGTVLNPNETTSTCAGCRRPRETFRSALRAVGVLANKHIPAAYLRGSIEQRTALLAGLLDTDGTVSPKGCVQFDNTNPKLASDVRELALSLGYRATHTVKRAQLHGRDCGDVYRVSFTCEVAPFRLPRKVRAHHERRHSTNPSRTSRRYITAVRRVPSVPVRCITVDSPSRLFLAGETFIATHNTSTAHAILAKITGHGWPVWVGDAKRAEFLEFRDWPNVQLVAGAIPHQVALIHRAWELMEYRYELIEAGRAKVTDFEPLVVFLDEYAEFVAGLLEWYVTIKVKGDPTKPPTLSQVASLARKARTARIHLLVSMQRPDIALLGGQTGEMRDNFGQRISMGRLSPQGAMMMWENPSTGVSLPRSCIGRATATRDDGRAVEMQCYRFPEWDAAEGTEQHTLLQRLRPGEVRHPRLLIVPPDDDQDRDLDTGDVVPPTFRDYAHAEWVLATARPDLDPLSEQSHIAGPGGRALSSTLASLGLDQADHRDPVSRRPERTLTVNSRDVDDREDLTLSWAEQTEPDEYAGYAADSTSYPRHLVPGGVLLTHGHRREREPAADAGLRRRGTGADLPEGPPADAQAARVPMPIGQGGVGARSA